MRLRTRLLIFSSAFLVLLPVSAIYFIDEIERSLLQGQEEAQQMTASAIATVVKGYSDLFTNDEDALYVYPQQQSLHIDGYASDDEDWTRLKQKFVLYDDKFSLLLIDNSEYLYAYLKVKDNDIVYRHPRYIPLDSSDHLRIEYIDNRKQHQRLVVTTEAQGTVSVYLVKQDWQTWVSGMHVNAVYGVWRETAAGYDIELRLPKNWLQPEHRLSFSIVNVFGENERYLDTASSTQMLANNLLNPVLFRSREISSAIRELDDSVSLICVIDKFGRVRAVTGGRQAAGFPCQATDKVSGELVDSVLAGNAQQVRMVVGDDMVILAAHPVLKENDTVGAVLVSNSSHKILAGQRQTLFNVMLATSLIFLLVIVSLLLFSSRLAFRIERLKRQSASLIDDSGRFINHVELADNEHSDEIGDLSRSFSDLLGKLNTYAAFLETVPRMLRHEILNPVNTISMSLQNIAEVITTDGSVDEAGKDIDVANYAIKQLQIIVSSLTEAANIDQALEQDTKELVDIAALLKEYVDNTQRKHDSIKLRYYGPEYGVLMSLNDVRIVQLLDKIKDNAVDFSPAGSEVSFHLDLSQGPSQGKQLVIRVMNTGELISQQQLDIMFQGMVSHRADKSSSPHLGIGLYVASKIAKYHHGQLTIANREDKKGVVVRLQLPLTD